MFPLIFQIPQLPDLKSQKYLSLYRQGVRQKVLSSQKDFLLLLSDIGRVYHLTFSIRYDMSDVGGKLHFYFEYFACFGYCTYSFVVL